VSSSDRPLEADPVLSEVEAELGRTLVDRRVLDGEELRRYVEDASRAGVPMTRALISSGRVGVDDVLDVVGELLGIPRFEPATTPDPAVVPLIDADTARRLQAIPYARDEQGRLLVAVADPLNEAKRAELSSLAGSEVRLALAEATALRAAIGRVYPPAGPRHARREGDGDDGGLDIDRLLDELVTRRGSDLHLTAGTPPQVRVDGVLVPLEHLGMLTPPVLRRLIFAILTDRQRDELETRRELDCSHPVAGKGRFRVNVFFQRDSVGAVLRAIPDEIVGLDELGMPPVVADFARLARGLVLVTGPTGSGKSTTLAALIDLVNTSRAGHIITVEDPIEFVHRHKRSIVNQREVGTDTLSFAEALRHALRQDPDVILVGEMRDLETIGTAITAAETGHLVFATLHTQNAPQSVERIIDVFPAYQQQQIRVQLASSLQAIVAQQLLPRRSGPGRVAAVEVMVATPAIRNLIREGKIHQIVTAMQAGGRHGMQTMDQALASLVTSGAVDHGVAMERAHDPGALRTLLEGYRS